jgi:hypothetical protein
LMGTRVVCEGVHIRSRLKTPPKWKEWNKVGAPATSLFFPPMAEKEAASRDSRSADGH